MLEKILFWLLNSGGITMLGASFFRFWYMANMKPETTIGDLAGSTSFWLIFTTGLILWIAGTLYTIIWGWGNFKRIEKRKQAANLDIIRARERAEKSNYIWDKLRGTFEYQESSGLKECFVRLMGDKSSFEYNNPIRAIANTSPRCSKCKRPLEQESAYTVQCRLCDRTYSKKLYTQYREDIKDAFSDKIRLFLEEYNEKDKDMEGKKSDATEAAR